MIFAEKLAGFSHDDEVASGAARRFVDATFFFGHSRAGIDRLACGFPTFKIAHCALGNQAFCGFLKVAILTT